MHFIVKGKIPVGAGNDFVRSPNMGPTIEKVMGDIKPEAAYFAVENGQRTIYFIVNAAGSSDIVRICEPLWLALGCDVEVVPAMNQEEFGAATATLGEIVSRY